MTDHDCPHAVTLRNLLDACERGRPLTDITDRLRVEVGRLDTAPRPTREKARKAVSRAVFDPGSVVKRENHTDGDPDELSVWQSKAVMAVLAEMGLIGGDDARAPADGAALVAAERRRQVESEGWTPEHDDQHTNGELVAAAVAYTMAADPYTMAGALDVWPWDVDWWKPTDDPIRNLVRAGALIAAEIDRRVRVVAADGAPPEAER